ncbi:MAG: NfeD family protein [Erysipelotrichaceae bacterium]|nr:NfeD family protein [Erysipelotrichaceae bacterium]
MDFLSNLSPSVMWIILIVVFSVVEALTFGLTTIWFAGGALLALFAALLGLSVPWQIGIFLLSSILLIYYTKPLAKNFLHIGSEKTNVEAVIGQEGPVTIRIEAYATGQVKINGQIWSALSEDGIPIEVGAKVKVIAVEGVKLIVNKV